MRRTVTIATLALLIFAAPAPAQLHDKDRPGEMESARLEELARQTALRLAGYQPREDGESEDGGLTPEQRSKITLHVDENGMVIIRGTQDDISRFDFIYGLVLEKMRQVGPPKPDIRKYKCVYIDVTVAAALLDDIFNGPQKARQRVAAQQRGRQQQQRGRQPQRGRQQQPEPEPEPEPVSSGATRGLESLADLFGIGEGKAADPTELMGIQIVPEKRTNYLFIMAKTELFPQIIDTLHTIDVEVLKEERDSDIVVLQHLNADEVKAMLEELLGITDARRAQQASAATRARRAGAQRRGRGQQGQAAAQLAEQIEDEMMQIGVGGQQFKLSDIKISSLAATNTIIVFGPEVARKSIVDIIKKLDDQGPKDGRVVAIPLEFAEAEPLADALQDSYGGSGRDRESNININAEASSNTIYVTAPENVRGEIIRQIMEAEAKATNVKTPRTIQILQGDVESIAAALELVFKDRKGRKKVTIVPDETSNQLIIKAPDDIYKEIAALVSKMDKPSDQILPKFYRLEHAYAPEVKDQVQDIVRQLVQSVNVTKGKMPNLGAFGVTADPATNSLIVMGTPMIFAILDTVVAGIDVKAKDPVRTTKTFPLAKNDANEVANNVNKLFGDPKRNREGMDPPRAEPNRSTNAVVVAGTSRQIEEIEKFINDLEAIAAPGEGGEVLPYIIALEHISADTAAETLTNIFEQRFEAIEQSGQKVKDAEKTVTITPDFITNQLFVNATKSNKAVIDEIVAMIDQEGSGIADVRSTEVFHLIYADPNSTAAAINKTFQKRGGRVPEKDQVTAAVDRGTKAVVVTASRRNLDKIRNIIEQLDVKPEEGTGRYAAVYSIRYADLPALRGAVNQAFNIPGARPEERVTAAADVPTGSLIVTANAERHGQISKLLEDLDQEKDTSRKFHTIKLTSGDATEAARTIQQLITEQTRGRRGQVKPTVVASPATNTLMIYASDSELAQFRPLIDAMDEKDSVAGEPQRIALEHQNAAQLADLLTQVFTDPARQMQRGRRGGTQKLVPMIISDDATNTLIVRAQQHDFDQIKGMVAKLDIETEHGPTGMRIITLAEGIDVEAMADKIELLIREGERHKKAENRNYKPKNVSIMADPRTSSLIVSGASAQFPEVERIVRELESKGPVGPTSIRVVKLRSIRSGDVKKVLDQLIEQRNQSRGRRRR